MQSDPPWVMARCIWRKCRVVRWAAVMIYNAAAGGLADETAPGRAERCSVLPRGGMPASMQPASRAAVLYSPPCAHNHPLFNRRSSSRSSAALLRRASTDVLTRGSRIAHLAVICWSSCRSRRAWLGDDRALSTHAGGRLRPVERRALATGAPAVGVAPESGRSPASSCR